MAAVGVTARKGELQDYWKRKVAEGKHKMSVLNAIRNKLIHRIYAVIDQGHSVRAQNGTRHCVDLCIGPKRKWALLKSNPPGIGLMNDSHNMGRGLLQILTHGWSSSCLKKTFPLACSGHRISPRSFLGAGYPLQSLTRI